MFVGIKTARCGHVHLLIHLNYTKWRCTYCSDFLGIQMFDQMITDLKNGVIPEDYLLCRRFETAMVKKMGVIRTPYSFWPADRKINPSTKELLWAAILLHDIENYRMIEAFITSEVEEKLRAKGLQNNSHDLTHKVEQTIQDYISEFLELAPSETFKKNLHQKVKSILVL